MHLADLGSYLKAQARASALYGSPEGWTQKAITAETRNATPCPRL
jgi:hypothetical protein